MNKQNAAVLSCVRWFRKGELNYVLLSSVIVSLPLILPIDTLSLRKRNKKYNKRTHWETRSLYLNMK